MQQKEPKFRILKGLSLSVSMALLCSTYAHGATDNSGNTVSSLQPAVKTSAPAIHQTSQKIRTKHKKHSHHLHSTARKTADNTHLPEEYSESFRVSAQLPPNYLKNNGDVDYAVKLVNYIDYASDGRPKPVGHTSYQQPQTGKPATPHKMPAEQVNLVINGPHIAKYEPVSADSARVSANAAPQAMLQAPNTPPAPAKPIQVALPVAAQVQQVPTKIVDNEKTVTYGTVKFLDAPDAVVQHAVAQNIPQPPKQMLRPVPVRVAHAAPVRNKPSVVQQVAKTTAPANNTPLPTPVAIAPQQVASSLPLQSQTVPKPIPVPPADNRTEANAVIAEPADRRNLLVSSNTVTTQPVSSDLPWLSHSGAKPALVASAEPSVIQTVRIVPLMKTQANSQPVSPVADDPNVAPHLIPPTIPASVPAPMVSGQQDLTGENPVPGISPQSQNVVNHLPPEKIIPHVTPEPVDISHERKNHFEQYMDEKSHSGQGIKISVKQPKESIEKMLETAYDDLIGGDQESAIGLYREVLVMEPENKLALFGLATTYHRAGQIQLARPLYAKLLEIDPYNLEGLNNFLVLLADESPKGALEELEKLEKSHTGFSPIPAQMAIIYEKMGDYDMAARKMDVAINLSPENLKYRYDMAIILDKKGDWADAAVLYKELLIASDRGEKIAANPEEIQQRLTFILSNRPKG